MGVRYTRRRSAPSRQAWSGSDGYRQCREGSGGGARVHERPRGAARLGPLVSREGVPRRGRPGRRRDGRRHPTELWASMVASRLARPRHPRGVRRRRPLLRRDGRRRRGAGPGRRPGPLLATVTQFAPMVREVGTPEQRAPLPVRGRLRRVHRERWPSPTTPWMALDDVTMAAERAEGGWVLQRHASSASWPTTASTRSPSSPVSATASAPSSFPAARRAWHAVRLARCEPPALHRHARPGRRPRRPCARRARQCGLDDRRSPGAIEEATVGARARDRRRLRRPLPDGARVRQGPQAVRRARSVRSRPSSTR